MGRSKLTLAVVAVVVVIVAVGIFFWATSDSSSDRDAQRMSDAHNLQQALADYFKDNGTYPGTPTSVACNTPNNNVANLAPSLVPKYIKAIPNDPKPPSCQANYIYLSDTKNYAVLIYLEDADPKTYQNQRCIAAASSPPPEDWEPLLKGYVKCP